MTEQFYTQARFSFAIAFVSLRKEGFLGLQLDDPSSYARFREEGRGVKSGKASPSHLEGLLAGGNWRV
jgi:hypothetical protein